MSVFYVRVCVCFWWVFVCGRGSLLMMPHVAKVKGALRERFYCGTLQEDYNTSVKWCQSDTDTLAWMDEVLIILGAFTQREIWGRRLCFSQLKKRLLGKLFSAADSWGLSGSETWHVNLCNGSDGATSECSLFDWYKTPVWVETLGLRWLQLCEWASHSIATISTASVFSLSVATVEIRNVHLLLLFLCFICLFVYITYIYIYVLVIKRL